MKKVNLIRGIPNVTVVRWNLFSDAVVSAFVIVTSTLFPGNTLHRVFIKERMGLWTLWIAACNAMMTKGIYYEKLSTFNVLDSIYW